MIEKKTVAAGRCDACEHTDYSDDNGGFARGYSVSVIEHATGTGHDAFACKETHIGKAARGVLHEWRNQNSDREFPADESDREFPGLDAPLLPVGSER